MSLFLKTYCRIKDGEVHINGELFCQHMDEEPFLRSVYKHIGLTYPKFFKMDELSRLGFIGAEMTLMRSELETYADDDVAVIFSNRSSSLQTDLQFYETLKSGIASPALFVYTLPNIEVGEICIRHKLYGENNFLITERFDAEQLLEQCEALFADNAAKAVLIGWTEAENDTHDGFFAFITASGMNEVTAESLTDIYLGR
ncbi:MAG: 3-oxoacyl-ACP synthase [Flavobacteriales bacterium]|nr:3-oxoacyl-ACP synthase [Flavobacteriales bacterium]